MYPKELEDLLKEYLTDGIITAQERKVLLKKAEFLGVDPDEFDLYIDAQQQKSDQETDAAVRKQRGETCPYCGGSVPMLTDKCPHCGQMISASASKELKEILDGLDSFLSLFKSGGHDTQVAAKAKCEEYINKAMLYYGNNPKVKLYVQNANEQIKEVIKEREAKEKKDNRAMLRGWVGILIAFIFLFIGTEIDGCRRSSSRTHSTEVVKNDDESTDVEGKEGNKEMDEFSQFEKDFKEAMSADNLDDASNLLYRATNDMTIGSFDKIDSYTKELVKQYFENEDYVDAELIIYRFKNAAAENWKNSDTYEYAKEQYKKHNLDFERFEYE